jgi:hypothetical protein
MGLGDEMAYTKPYERRTLPDRRIECYLMFGHRRLVGPRLLRQLQAELRKDASDNQAEGNSQADLRLWALFVGAYAEEKASVNVVMNRWHTVRFM